MVKNTAQVKNKKEVVPEQSPLPSTPLPPVPETPIAEKKGAEATTDTRVQAKSPKFHPLKGEVEAKVLPTPTAEHPTLGAQIPIPAEPPVPIVEKLPTEEQYWRSTSEFEIETAYQALNLANRDLTTLASFELVIVSRNGAIAERKKLEAQDQGRMAEVRMVQAELDRLARQYAILKLAETSLPATLSDLNNKRRLEMPVEIVIRVAGEEVVITQQLLHEMAPSYSSGQNLFMQGAKNICTTAQHAITMAQSKANNGNGKNYGLPFDFQSPMAEIRNKHLAHGDQ